MRLGRSAHAQFGCQGDDVASICEKVCLLQRRLLGARFFCVPHYQTQGTLGREGGQEA